jgi:predicted kinase
VTSLPTLVVVSGPPGAGKTTLAHEIARAVGCPAICRDEIKEGMAHATPGFVPGPGDELTSRTHPVFFGVLELLMRAGVTTVAEAAFQDGVWRPGLERLRHLARIRIVHCVVGADVALQRRLRRTEQNPSRRAHPDPRRSGTAGPERARGVCGIAGLLPPTQLIIRTRE